MKSREKKFLVLLFIALLFIMPVTGCGTTKLDNPNQKQEKSDDWMEEETFPRIKDLTGEWYLASVTVRNQDKEIIVQLYLHFLGYYPRGCARKEIDDYLGMEAWFVYEPVQKIFNFDGFNTDAI